MALIHNPTFTPPAVGEYVHCSVFSNIEEEGNPTIVARLATWPSTDRLQSFAKTAVVDESTFIIVTDHTFEIRWFGRDTEVPLCGHGALAVSALFSQWFDGSHFQKVHNLGNRLALGNDNGVPAIALQPINLIELPISTVAIGITPIQIFDAGRDFLIILENEQQLRAYQPDWLALQSLTKIGCILCAPSSTATAAFRFFAPRAGIGEDRASASVIPALIAYWSRTQTPNYQFVQCSGVDIMIGGRQLANQIVVSGKVFELARGNFVIS